LLIKLPTPLSSEVCEPVIVGLSEEPQHTPRAVTAAPPSFVITPPLVAVVVVMADTVVVVKVGITASFLQLLITTTAIIKQTKTKNVNNLFMTL
jgi:hypothetical protein